MRATVYFDDRYGDAPLAAVDEHTGTTRWASELSASQLAYSQEVRLYGSTLELRTIGTGAKVAPSSKCHGWLFQRCL